MPDPTKTPVDWVLDLEFGGHRLFDARDRGRLLRDHGLVRPDIRRVVLSRFYEGLETDAVNAALHGSLCSWLAESDLVRADRTAAAAGLDLRFPLLDRDVLETAALLPGSSKVRRVRGSLHTRWPLRAMVKGTLPAALLNRPKRGLPKPLDNWLEGPGRLFMEERFARLRQDTFGLWRPDALDQLRRDLARRAGAGIRLWTLFVLDAWLHGLTE
jgi:asparagine synthase (glutamine-hydrolysing)